ncbi:MAG: amidohydrolase family protein, partial [Methanomicrobiales archaeon]|nr:amidohydrolase family protein [Methanomicrobiales archaeon]
MEIEHIFEGQVFLGEALDLTPARIITRGGIVTAVEELKQAPPRWICPCFFNAHTHVGDTVALDTLVTGSLEELVTPPDGLKHRILASSPRDTLRQAMRAALTTMIRSGTGGSADFREGGPAGVTLLREAADGLSWVPVIFGREGGEMIAEGLGISSVRDIAGTESLVEEARKKGKRIAFHAGERDSEDVEEALALQPDLLVHMTHATDSQLRRCADERIPIAVCPRSNWTLGMTGSSSRPPLRRMVVRGCSILLGTDNVMFVQPDLFREMSFVSTVYHLPSPL